jgi:hypothetical protein
VDKDYESYAIAVGGYKAETGFLQKRRR